MNKIQILIKVVSKDVTITGRVSALTEQCVLKQPNIIYPKYLVLMPRVLT